MMTDTETKLLETIRNLVLVLSEKVVNIETRLDEMNTRLDNLSKPAVSNAPSIEDVNTALINGSLMLAPGGLPVVGQEFSSPVAERLYNAAIANLTNNPDGTFTLTAFDVFARSYVNDVPDYDAETRKEVIAYMLRNGWDFSVGYFHRGTDMPIATNDIWVEHMVYYSERDVYYAEDVKNDIANYCPTWHKLLPGFIIDTFANTICDMLQDVRGSIIEYSRAHRYFTLDDLKHFANSSIVIRNVVANLCRRATFGINDIGGGNFTNLSEFPHVPIDVIQQKARLDVIRIYRIGTPSGNYVHYTARNAHSTIMNIPSPADIIACYEGQFQLHCRHNSVQYRSRIDNNNISKDIINAICSSITSYANIIRATCARVPDITGIRSRLFDRYRIAIDIDTLKILLNV